MPTVRAKDAFALVEEWGKQNAAAYYGGIWADESGNLTVGFTASVDEYGLAIRRIFPESHAKAVAVDYAMSDLLALQSTIDAERQVLRGQGIRISTTGIDPSRSRVVVGVEGLNADAERELRGRYGEGVVLEERGFPRFNIAAR